MKISDAEILRVKSHAKTMNAYCNASGDHLAQDYYIGVIDVCEELQQHREDKRWRDVKEEEPYVGLEYQIKSGAYFYHHTFEYKGDGIFECRGYRTSYQAGKDLTHWRPLPTDLPEGEKNHE